MRSSKSRSRSKTNRPRTLGNIVNRVFDSSGPEGKVRGTPAQLIEKYQFLARDAQLSNDRVAAENFMQHAEHYTRMLAEAMREMAAEQEQRQQFHQQNGQSGQGGQSNQGGQGGSYGQRDRQGDRDVQPRQEQRYDNRREERSEYRDDRGDEQPMPAVAAVIELAADNEAGLVETPEGARAQGGYDSPRPRSEHPRSERPRGERPHETPRRPHSAAPRTEPRAEAAPRAEPRAEPSVAPPPEPPVTAEAPKKPRSASSRPRSPRKPAEAGKASPDNTGSDNAGPDPREAAE